MSIENRLLSKVIDEGTLTALMKFNVGLDDFIHQKETYQFIKNFNKEFGHIPSFAEVVAECEGFEYIPEVPDNVAYMCKKLKSDNAKRRSYELLQKEAAEQFSKLSGSEFVNWLYEETAKIKEISNIEVFAGTNFATNGQERREMYLSSKESRTYSYIPTPYPSLTEWLGGGFELGDYVLLQAYTNKGKSWLASQVGIKAFNEGFGVIHYSPELSQKQQLQRLDGGKYS